MAEGENEMKKYKFSELNEMAKYEAVKDYQKGWLETHPYDAFTFHEAWDLIQDTEEDVFYNEEGEIIDED